MRHAWLRVFCCRCCARARSKPSSLFHALMHARYIFWNLKNVEFVVACFSMLSSLQKVWKMKSLNVARTGGTYTVTCARVHFSKKNEREFPKEIENIPYNPRIYKMKIKNN